MSTILLFIAPLLWKRFYQLSLNLPKKIGISESTFLPPSTLMKYEDAMKVLRKLKHHCPQDKKTHLDEEMEQSLHLHHPAGGLSVHLQSASFPIMMMTMSGFSLDRNLSSLASFL
jgi:hypothetical protein